MSINSLGRCHFTHDRVPPAEPVEPTEPYEPLVLIDPLEMELLLKLLDKPPIIQHRSFFERIEL